MSSELEIMQKEIDQIKTATQADLDVIVNAVNTQCQGGLKVTIMDSVNRIAKTLELRRYEYDVDVSMCLRGCGFDWVGDENLQGVVDNEA